MKPNQKLFCAVVAGASIVLSGCSKDKDLPFENLTIVEEGNVPTVEKAESKQPTAILGSGGSMAEVLKSTFTNIVPPEKAKHVVVACGELDECEAAVMAAYQRGAVITVVDPLGAVVNRWCGARKMIFSGDPVTTESAAWVSFNRKAVSMAVKKTTAHKEEELIEEDEVPLVIFTGWLDDVLKPTLQGPDYRSKDIKKRVVPQRVSHVFPIEIPKDALNETYWAFPENVSLTSTAELECKIYPIHSFADNASFSGDFYVVEAELTIHNPNLYNGKWQYTQGDKLYESCGFYLSQCVLTSYLYNSENNGMILSDTHMFAGGPAPESADASSLLKTGFEWSFDGWVSTGSGLESTTPNPIQNGVWTWNNTNEISGSGLNVSTETPGGNIRWALEVADLPDDREKPVPAAASGDLKFNCSWIWAVPQAKDGSDNLYYMYIDLKPVYRVTRSLLPSNRLDGQYLTPYPQSSYFMLVPPSRAEGQRI